MPQKTGFLLSTQLETSRSDAAVVIIIVIEAQANGGGWEKVPRANTVVGK